MSKIDKAIEKLIVGLAVSVPYLSGLGLLGYQIYSYLQLGLWKPFSVIDLLIYAGAAAGWVTLASWAAQPGSWVGLHKLISHVPLSLFLIVAGIVLDRLLSPAVEQDSRQQ